MDYHDPDETRWWRRPRTLAIPVVLALLAMGLLFLVAPWQDDDTAPRTEPTAPSTETSDGGQGASSRCGLPDGDQSVPTTPIRTQWRQVDQVVVPFSPDQYGPAEETDGIYTCFARSPEGALVAAAMDFAQGGSGSIDATQYVRARYAREGNYARELRRSQDGGTATDEGLTGEIAGFRVLRYSPAQAQLEVVGRALESQFAGQLISVYYELTWQDGDWLIVAPDDPADTVASPDTLAAYTTWPAGEASRFSNSDFSPRAAPGWAVRGTTSTLNSPVVSTTAASTITLSTPAAAQASAAQQGRACDKKLSLECLSLTTKVAKVGAGALVRAAPERAVSAAVDATAGSAVDAALRSVTAAQEWALKEMLTAWLKSPDPDLQGSDSMLPWLQDRLGLFVVFITAGAVLLGAYRLAVTGRFEHLGELGMVFARVILSGGLVATVVTLGLQIGDLFTAWILAQVDFDLDGMLTLSPSSPAWIIFIFGWFVILVQIFQLMIMIFRYGAVLYLCAVVTLFAGASNTRVGKQGWEKSLAWLLAFVFYKPVAALIYAGAIMMTNSGRDAADQVAGLAMTVLALVALPALMRLIAPHTAALGGANAGALAGATVGAALATGAVMATGGGAAAAGAGFAGLSGGGGGSMAAGTVTGGSGAGGGAAGGGAAGGGAAGGGAAGGGGSGGGGSGPPSGVAPVSGGDPGVVSGSSTGGSTGTSGGGAPADGSGSGPAASGASASGSGGSGAGGAAPTGAGGAGAGGGLAGPETGGLDRGAAPSGAAGIPSAGGGVGGAEMLRGAGSGSSTGGRVTGAAGGAVDGVVDEGPDPGAGGGSGRPSGSRGDHT